MAQPVTEQRNATEPRTSCIAVESLDAYFGAARVVRDVSFAVQSGRVTAIIGPSGCGKSTLLRCLNRMHETVPGARVEGEVRFEGRDIYCAGGERDRRAPAHRHGLPAANAVPDDVDSRQRRGGAQDPAARTSVRRDARRTTSWSSALRRAALWDEVSDRLGASAIALSGGQQQRLCIARALATSPTRAASRRADGVARSDSARSASKSWCTSCASRSRSSSSRTTCSRRRASRTAPHSCSSGEMIEYGADERHVHGAERSAHRSVHHRTVRMTRDCSSLRRVGCADGPRVGHRREFLVLVRREAGADGITMTAAPEASRRSSGRRVAASRRSCARSTG